MTDQDFYPNDGHLWPCGCVMGDPACQCARPATPTEIHDCPLAPYIAQAWHDVTCPEGPDCRDRLMHSAAQPLAYTGTLAAFLDRLAELKAS